MNALDRGIPEILALQACSDDRGQDCDNRQSAWHEHDMLTFASQIPGEHELKRSPCESIPLHLPILQTQLHSRGTRKTAEVQISFAQDLLGPIWQSHVPTCTYLNLIRFK